MSVRKREKLLSKIIVSVLAAGSLYGLGIGNINAYAEDLDGTDNDGYVEVENNKTYYHVFGIKKSNDYDNAIANGGTVIMRGGTVEGTLCGGYTYTKLESLTIAKESPITANENKVYIYNGKVVRSIYGGIAEIIEESYVSKVDTSIASENEVIIRGETAGDSVFLGSSVFGGCSINQTRYLTPNSITKKNKVTISGGTRIDGNIYGGYSESIYGTSKSSKNEVIIEDGTTVHGKVYGGYSRNGNGNGKANNNKVTINGGTVTGNIYGGYGEYNVNALDDNSEINNNKVIISGGTILSNVYGGDDGFYYINTESNMIMNLLKNNTIILKGTPDISKANLFGSNRPATGTNNNNLDIDGFTGAVNSLNNFNNINLNNIQWKNKGTVLEVINNNQTSDLSNTYINVNSLNLQGGSTIQENDTMTLISGTNLGIDNNKVRFNRNFTAGVATIGEGEATVTENNINYKITNIKLNPQTKLIAENRAVAAAFINQGSDLISSGLDSLHDQYGYGFKTFAAVYGNRSTYDAGGDLKINGWSEIIGLGSSKEFADGDLDWGVFYENGSGNYRTYNQFNDEFFRGDGSMVYNGGGIAARFTKNNGWYYEGSLRAGTLKSEIDNALKDGNGNMYGYKSDTTYYGAHLGLGKIVELNDSQDLNVYGKYFHTYNDGDEFSIAGDKFSFDSVTSDRIMLGAKITANKDNAWKTHYGLAWEYEFNGDSDMRAGQFDVPTQSLKGSTFIGEIGFSYQDKSPWSFDVSFKGYQGERDGFSGHAQATYNF